MISPHALELAQTLVRMNTVSHRSNLELIHFIRDHLAQLGVKSRLTWNADKTKANLFATLGEGKPAGVILSGHTDTVPWDGQDWSMDPLGAVVQDGRLFGRGSADMKAFIGIALSQAEQFLNSDAPFAVHFAFTYEEEIGCFGVKELIADLRDAGIRPLACIVGEPTSMVPAIAHKGVYRYKCCVRGKEAHSSLTPHSVNAIEMAARVVGRLRDMAEGFEQHEPRFEGFDVPFSTPSVGQSLLAPTNHTVDVEEMHGIDNLVLQKCADADDSPDATAPDQQPPHRRAAKSAVIAHVSNHTHRIAQIPLGPHHGLALAFLPMALKGMVEMPEARFRTRKTFSVMASERTKSP